MSDPAVFDELHEACARLGALLFSITVTTASGDAIRRVYTSNSVQYPVSGIKPLPRNAWYEHVILGLQCFIANRPEDFKELFSDHQLIESLGIGSILNMPVIDDGEVLGTINVLGAKDHFTPAMIAGYREAMMRRHATLVQAIKAGGDERVAAPQAPR